MALSACASLTTGTTFMREIEPPPCTKTKISMSVCEDTIRAHAPQPRWSLDDTRMRGPDAYPEPVHISLSAENQETFTARKVDGQRLK